MEEQILQARLQAFNCIPVLARAADLDHHHSFCRETLFPLFNGVIDVVRACLSVSRFIWSGLQVQCLWSC
jgi:hypothetical protein